MPRSCSWSIVPIAPSATTTRSRKAESRSSPGLDEVMIWATSLPAPGGTARTDNVRTTTARHRHEGAPRGQLLDDPRGHRWLAVVVPRSGARGEGRRRLRRHPADRVGLHADVRP